MQKYKIKFHKKIGTDLSKIDRSVLVLFEKKLLQLQNEPKLGKELGNRNGLDLSGYRKTYFGKKKYRIVYKIKESKIMIYVISVGKRDKMKAYLEAFKRKNK